MENEVIKHEEYEIANQEELNNSPHGLISQALAQNANIETIERLMALQERWEQNQARKAFFTALTNFQSDLPEIKREKKVKYKTKDGGEVDYDYAPLPKIIETIKPFMKKYGLSYRWEFEENGKIKGTCILTHKDGHSERCTMEAGKDTSGKKNDIQSIGSTRSYLQRYTLIGALGIGTAQKDDDGQSSKSGEPEKIPEPKEKINWSKLIKNCESIKELTAVWGRMSELEQKEHKKTFTEIKENIETESKKQKK